MSSSLCTEKTSTGAIVSAKQDGGWCSILTLRLCIMVLQVRGRRLYDSILKCGGQTSSIFKNIMDALALPAINWRFGFMSWSGWPDIRSYTVAVDDAVQRLSLRSLEALRASAGYVVIAGCVLRRHA